VSASGETGGAGTASAETAAEPGVRATTPKAGGVKARAGEAQPLLLTEAPVVAAVALEPWFAVWEREEWGRDPGERSGDDGAARAAVRVRSSATAHETMRAAGRCRARGPSMAETARKWRDTFQCRCQAKQKRWCDDGVERRFWSTDKPVDHVSRGFKSFGTALGGGEKGKDGWVVRVADIGARTLSSLGHAFTKTGAATKTCRRRVHKKANRHIKCTYC